ncbi:MAG: hypothetical protein U0P81_03050 [Holophagaceae bacterium]
MILPGSPPSCPAGIWILEGVPLSGKTTLLRRWRTGSGHRVLWSGEDAATQRRFEPLQERHRPDAVEPWLEGLLDAWEALVAGSRGLGWAREGTGFAAHQERFHLSALVEGGLTPEGFRRIEDRLAALGARGVLLRIGGTEGSRRLERSAAERPPSWMAWVLATHGSRPAAAEAWAAQQARLLEAARGSALGWHLVDAGAVAVEPPGPLS